MRPSAPRKSGHARQRGLGDKLCLFTGFRQNAIAHEDTSGMWYFAYGSNLNSRAVAEWCRHYGYRAPAMRPGKPAVLDNYRLSFPIFSEYWAGGIGDIVYDPGKYVMGALFDLSENELHVLDAKVNRKLDGNGKEVGTYKRIEVSVSNLGKSDAIPAITYQGISVERYHIPPTQHYMDLVIQGAYSFGLSMMWIAYLQSFPLQQGRKPRPPGAGDTTVKS